MDIALYFSSLPSKISSHSDALSRVTLVAGNHTESQHHYRKEFIAYIASIILLAYLSI
jgi:hypothetical protein